MKVRTFTEMTDSSQARRCEVEPNRFLIPSGIQRWQFHSGARFQFDFLTESAATCWICWICWICDIDPSRQEVDESDEGDESDDSDAESLERKETFQNFQVLSQDLMVREDEMRSDVDLWQRDNRIETLNGTCSSYNATRRFQSALDLKQKSNYIPSGNQTWQWNTDPLSMIFLLKTSIHRGFSSQPCLITKGYIHYLSRSKIHPLRTGLAASPPLRLLCSMSIEYL